MPEMNTSRRKRAAFTFRNFDFFLPCVQNFCIYDFFVNAADEHLLAFVLAFSEAAVRQNRYAVRIIRHAFVRKKFAFQARNAGKAEFYDVAIELIAGGDCLVVGGKLLRIMAEILE